MSEKCSGCGEENEKLYMHSICHTNVPTWAVLDEEKSELEIICAECEKPITKFKVLRIIK